jgi:hypothetical protein
MGNIERLPERVYAFTDAYGEHVGVSLTPLPVGPRLMGVESEYVRADLHRGAVEALTEAVAAARTFNRGGMTWLEYDAALVRFERIANGGQ